MLQSNRGKKETESLLKDCQSQITRLTVQLQECEEYKDSMDEDEYNEMREETLKEMEEIKKTLQGLAKGNLGLISEIDSAQLAMQAAVSQAFKTPEVIELFAKSQPKQLRRKLVEIKRDYELKKVPEIVYKTQALEILGALKKLREKLTSEEVIFLEKNMSDEMKKFVEVDDDLVDENKIKQ